MFSSGSMRLLNFLISLILPWIFFLWWRFFFSFFFVLRYFISGVCLFVYYTCLLFVYFGRAGSMGIFWRAGSCIYFVCVSPLCGVPCRYNFIWALRWCGRRDCTDFPFLRLCSGGYGTVEMVKGVVRVFLCFLQFAVSSLGGWISAVGIFVLYFSLVTL